MFEKLKKQWVSNPLPLIMAAAILFRLLAAVFSKGYAMSDDHFVIIRIAQRWLDGYNDWFDKDHPSGFSLVYPGLHYVLFYILKIFGVTDPQTKMLIVRLLHAAYSLPVVLLGFKITRKLGDDKSARQVGILLALFWLLPFMSVRNLVEVVCIPPMILGFYLALLSEEKEDSKLWIWAGFFFGLAFAFRYQTLLLTGTLGLVLVARKNWQKSAYYAFGVVLGLFLLQGVVDLVAWGYPFAAFLQYSLYNVENRFAYVVGPWYRYILLIMGVLIPPASLYLIFGMLRSWKKYALLFWPVLVFFVFHSYYPNKQERFILPILPFLIILGILGWNNFVAKSGFWHKHTKLLHGTWIWFWIINTILLVTLTFTYTKRTMVEPLTYLSDKTDLNALVLEYAEEDMPWFPRFYLEKDISVYRFFKGSDDAAIKQKIQAAGQGLPNYYYFYGPDNLETRVEKIQATLNMKLVFEKKIDPSNIDWLLHTLNPRNNKNHTGFIYRLAEHP